MISMLSSSCYDLHVEKTVAEECVWSLRDRDVIDGDLWSQHMNVCVNDRMWVCGPEI